MSRGTHHLARAIDEVLAAANLGATRKTAEQHAIKVAAAQPKTELARGLRTLAETVRTASDDVTYADLLGDA